MKTPSTPENEANRQRALDETGLLNCGAEMRFDRITRLACQTFSVPIALVSLIDHDRQWFKSRQGLDAPETPRGISFCGHAILSNAPLIVEDTLNDDRFVDNPLVTGAPDIRFYAGVPLHADGHRIGTLCLIDSQPRDFPGKQVDMLQDLAAIIETLIQADADSRTSRSTLESALVASRDELASLVNNMPGVTFRCLPDESRTMLYISGQVDKVSGYPAKDLIGNARLSYADLIHPDDAPTLAEAVTDSMAMDQNWYLKYRIRHRSGEWRWVEERGRAVTGDAHFARVHEGFIVDITAEQHAQAQLRKHQDALVLLNDIAFNAQVSLDAKVTHALEKARHYLGMDLAILSQIEGDVYTARWVDAVPEAGVQSGQCFSLGETWCNLLFTGQSNKLFVADASQSELHNHPCYQSRPLGAFAGIVIEVEGRTFGTLNFSASRTRPNDFDESETLFVRLLARWLSDTLENSLNSERLIKLMEQLPGTVYQFRQFSDGRSVFPFSSPQIQALYGLTPAQAAVDASPAFERIHPDDLDAIAESIEHSANTLENWQATYRVRSRGTGYRWVAGQARPERLTDGSVLWHGYLNDIHEQEQARQALARNESRLRSLFEFAPIGIALNDLESGQFIDLNNALLAPTGYTREEFVNLSYWQVTPKEYQLEEDKALSGLQSEGRYGPFEKEYIRKDGSRYPVRLQGMLSHDPDGRPVIWSLIEDITERRRLDKMKDQFIATVSHELRTPLTSIKGSLGLMSGGAAGVLPAKVQTLLNTAVRNAERLASLINDLLDMEKLVAGKMPMNLTTQLLGPLIDDAVESMSSYSEQHKVRILTPGTWPGVQVRVDGPRLIQALTNLISNAVKFSPPDQPVEISVGVNGDTVQITVRDHGPGVDPAFRSQLFQRFSQADSSDTRKLPGTGLGLAITREICQQLGGEVDYRDAPGGGGEFYIQLPGTII